MKKLIGMLISFSLLIAAGCGFGISTRVHVTQVAAHADGVVIGSALVNCIRDNLAQRTRIAPALAAKASDFALGVRR